jgi:hypothetical protein
LGFRQVVAGNLVLHGPTATKTFIYKVLTIPFLKLLSPIARGKKKELKILQTITKKDKMEKLKTVMENHFY